LAVVHDYDNYQRVYRPVVTSSRTLACADTSQEFQMEWQRKVLFVKAAMQGHYHGHYHAHDVMIDAHRGYSVAEAVEVCEIVDYGHPEDRLLPPDSGNGFLWRIRSAARFVERDGGVYLELEAIALTRDVPASLTWMVNPVVNRISVGSLTSTLRQTRDAVVSAGGNPTVLTSCSKPVHVAMRNSRSGPRSLRASRLPDWTFRELTPFFAGSTSGCLEITESIRACFQALTSPALSRRRSACATRRRAARRRSDFSL
jgi:hypothetical protein